MSDQLDRLRKLLARADAAGARHGAGDATTTETPSRPPGEFPPVANTIVVPALESAAVAVREAGHYADVKISDKPPSSFSGYPELKVSFEIRFNGAVGGSTLTFSNHGSSRVLVSAAFKNKAGNSEMHSANSFPVASLTQLLVETLAVDFVEGALMKVELI